jgi:hypothetical protein
MTNYSGHDYVIHALLIMSCVAQLIPALYALRICRITGWTKYWSASWIVFTVVMFWIMLRRLLVALTYDYRCEPVLPWLFDQVISTIVTSSGLTIVAVLKYRFYRYWLEASVIRIDARKKAIANDQINKEQGHIKDEQQAVDQFEKSARDRGPEE